MMFRIAVLALFSCVLSACGGGGGGGGGSGQPPGGGSFQVTLDRSALTFQATEGSAPPSQTVVATWTGTPPDPVYISATVEGTGIAPTIPTVVTASSATATVSVASGLAAGSYSGRINFLVCRDAGCAQRVGGSPLPVSFTVTVAAGTGSNPGGAGTPIRAFASPPPPPFILGSSASSASSSINVVADATTSWTVASNTPWMSASVASGTGNAAVAVQIDTANLDIGTHIGNVTIVNSGDPTNSIDVPVTATVVAPLISISATPVVIGAADGLSTARTETFALSINTGANSFPWAATATTDNGDAWLTLPAASGQTSSSATNITVDGDASLVDPGRYTGTVTIQVNVRGHTYSRSVPVVLNKEGHWLQASAHGAAFSSFPGRSVLSRSVQITSTQGRTDVPWSATSNASWLSVTASGTTGDTLQLTADPTGLQRNTTHIATVTIVSSDPAIMNQESIRVAFWGSATDPQDEQVDGWRPLIAANPVEPWVYTNGSGWNGGTYVNDSTIRIYNVYTGALVDSWTTTLTDIGEMTVSADGTLLFVSDWGSQTIVALNARTGATVRSYAYTQYLNPNGLSYIANADRPTLIVGNGQLFDVTSGTRLAGTLPPDVFLGRLSFAVDPLSRRLYAQDQGLSASSLHEFSIKRTALVDDGIAIARLTRTSGGENGQDVCVSSDGARVYTANGFPYQFAVFSASPFEFTQYLPGRPYPVNTECGWNGIFVGGADAYYDTTDVWVYRADGSLLTSLRMGDVTSTEAAERSLQLSGDNSRLIGTVKGAGIPTPILAFKSIPAP